MRYLIRPATPADDAGILALVQATPQRGRVLLNFERQPAFLHGSAVSCEAPELWIAVDEQGAVIAVFNVGRRRVLVNGQVHPVRYAHDLRLAPAWQGSTLLVRLFRQLRQILRTGEWMQTVILSDNSTSLDTVGSGRAGLPVYYPCGEIETSLLFSGRRRRAHGYRITQATVDDLPLMQAWLDEHGPRRQFFPRYQLADLINGHDYYRGLVVQDFLLAWRGTELVGMTGTWSQKSFKQTRVLRYPFALGGLRHLLNLYSRLRGGLHLPAAGGTLDYRMLHSTLVRDDAPAVLDALLQPLVEQARRERCALSAGFFLQDPLREAAGGYRRQRLASRHFLVSYEQDPRPLLDGRLPYVEVARL